jgi:hypothetical protein
VFWKENFWNMFWKTLVRGVISQMGMLAELLVGCKIEKDKIIARHPEANYYRREKGELRQFKIGDMPYESFKKLPQSSRAIVFNYAEENLHCGNYCLPVFLSSHIFGGRVIFLEYDTNGEIKKWKGYDG